MRLLLDEQLSPEIAQQLQRRGHDVLSVAGAGLRGHADAAVLALAVSQERAVVTEPMGDFRPLHANDVAAATTHDRIILRRSSNFSLRRGSLGEVVTDRERLLYQHRHPEALLGPEISL
ncbi:MAG TPA: DUF5615 family PIN-like protein [Candidatus Dormibacteraeota bacterium]|nr:DUF5615 family PIN-like protein [Candidatus Dormibacteraeota bacterium]